jgi:tetratricopeptide (TPR) repeat protein
MIFFSYSWQDRAIAMRIYYDLVAAGVYVWRDQVDMELAINFEKELYKVIEGCEYFIFLDTENSRNSKWCPQEINHYLSLSYNSHKKIIVCLGGDKDIVHKKKELFDGHNSILYFDFFINDTYDNNGKYNLAINDLCLFLNSHYVAWNKIPQEKDFIDELASQQIKLDDINKSLIKDFENIRLRSLQGYANVEERLKILVDDCEKMGVDSIFPYLSLGVTQAGKGNFKSALLTFNKVVDRFPVDPRGWRGYGSCNFFSDNFHEALTAFLTAHTLTVSSNNERHKFYINEIKENIAQTFTALGQDKQALSVYKEIFTDLEKANRLTPRVYLNLCEYLEKAEEENKIEEKLIKGIEQFYGDADLYARLGKFYFENGSLTEAIVNFEIAHKYSPNDLHIFAQLFLLYSKFPFYKENKLNFLRAKIENYDTKTLEDNYLMGLVYYIDEDIEKAHHHFNLSNRYADFYSTFLK